MTISNPPKAFILLVALICITVLLAVEKITTEAGLPLVSAIVFYGIGNGVAAKSGVNSQPIIGKKEER
jgi:hypothetical protein